MNNSSLWSSSIALSLLFVSVTSASAQESSKTQVNAIGTLQPESAGEMSGSGGLGLSGVGRGEVVGTRKYVHPLWFKAEGDYPLAHIDAVAARGEPNIQSCYVKTSAANGGFQGTIQVDFQIGKKGKLSALKFSQRGTLTPAFKACMGRELSTWSFPKPKSGKPVAAAIGLWFEAHAIYKQRESGAMGFGLQGVGGTVSSGKPTPSIIPGKPVVRGSLDKTIIRRVVRQHRNEIRYCYEKELIKTPGLSGQIRAKFIISGKGLVTSSTIGASTLKRER